MTRELSVIVPTYGRSEKLQTLMAGIGTTTSEHDAFEVIVVVDGRDETPLDAASVLPESIRFVGLTKDHAGPAAARNFAIEHAQGDWVLFYDDDARVDEKTIGGHLDWIRRSDDSTDAHLGRVDWPDELIDSPWRVLLADSSMLFFWEHMTSGQSYGFRHFWTTNLSVRRDLVRRVGGFNEGFPSAIHEDIELGWRLHREFGLEVCVDTAIRCLHDHALAPRDYFFREHKSGASAKAAAAINPDFHAEVWGWADDAASMHRSLTLLSCRSGRYVLNLLESWAEPSARRPSADEVRSAYLIHLPLKRMAFLQGYLGQPFEEFWDRLQPS
jgi:glycosyltransferase involved in cell wall biosynthesis